MDKEISSFESKMEEIRAKKYNELSNIEKDIQLLEFLRKDYESTNMRFKGIKYLFKLYKINPTCKKIATKEIFDIVSKILLSLFLYFAAFIINNLFISKGYFTGVNGFVIIGFVSFSIYYIASKYNKKTKETLEYSQNILRDYKFNTFNVN
jgi:hypothetical protein